MLGNSCFRVWSLAHPPTWVVTASALDPSTATLARVVFDLRATIAITQTITTISGVSKLSIIEAPSVKCSAYAMSKRENLALSTQAHSLSQVVLHKVRFLVDASTCYMNWDLLLFHTNRCVLKSNRDQSVDRIGRQSSKNSERTQLTYRYWTANETEQLFDIYG